MHAPPSFTRHWAPVALAHFAARRRGRLAATFPLPPPGEECTSPLEPHLFFALRIHWHYHCCRFSWDFSSPFDVFPFQFAPTTITRTRGLPVEHVRGGSLHFGLSLGLFFAIISLNFEEKEITL
jgi:hypothetical protein